MGVELLRKLDNNILKPIIRGVIYRWNLFTGPMPETAGDRELKQMLGLEPPLNPIGGIDKNQEADIKDIDQPSS